MFFRPTIRAHVMSVLDSVIAKEEEKYIETCDAIDRSADQQKVLAREQAVHNIVGNFMNR